MPAAKKPEPVAKGPKWLRKAFAERDAYIEASRPKAGAGETAEQYPDGILLKGKTIALQVCDEDGSGNPITRRVVFVVQSVGEGIAP